MKKQNFWEEKNWGGGKQMLGRTKKIIIQELNVELNFLKKKERKKKFFFDF
jgi:flagellin-specific chaperone FliS